MIRAFILLATSLIVASSVWADTIAITNAHIHTVGRGGEIENGTIVIRDGRIVAVGARVRAPAGAEVIDAGGRPVTPGLFIAGTNLGAVEVDLVSQTDDTATKNRTLSAAFDISYGIDPESFVIPIARVTGVTRALTTPGYADGDERQFLFAGQGALVSLAEGGPTVVRPRAAMMLELGEGGAARVGGARGSALTQLRADLDDVRWYMRHRRSFDSGNARDLRHSKADLDALIPVVQGRMPLIVRVHRASDIREVLWLAREQRLRVILSGAEEGWMVARDIARARVPVLLHPTADLPASFEVRAATLENAARLEEAGVVIAFANSDGGHRIREVRFNAGNAVAHGLSHSAALAALTINTARIFGEAARVGSLEAGKQADVVIWNGDPLEPMSQAETVIINGEVQPMDSRALDLARRYRDRESPYPPAYHHR